MVRVTRYLKALIRPNDKFTGFYNCIQEAQGPHRSPEKPVQINENI